MSDATPYGGAVKQCPTCTDTPTPGFLDGIGECDCSGGWVDVPTTYRIATKRGPCGLCGESDEHTCMYDQTRVRPPVLEWGETARSWAYPQPGDWVLTLLFTNGGDTMRVEMVGGNDGGILCRRGDGNEKHWMEPADLRLIIDHPNASRIPGTETPT
jgi:hypothetical protein